MTPARAGGGGARGGQAGAADSAPGAADSAPGAADSAPGAERLKRYRAKRDFERTPEPEPAQIAATPGTAPRFVVHEHSASRLHWDLRLERDGVLASWAIPKGLPEAPGENRLAVWTEEHPLEYIDFHGEIPKGQYGAGTMTIWDSGTYDCLKWEPRKIEVALHGRRLDARYALFPIAKEEQPREWMIHRMDPPADRYREPMPERIKPMLARTGRLPPDDGRWLFEVKWDGVRAIAYSTPGELRLHSRNLKDITAQYPELGRLGRALGSHSAVLDGEIVAFDERGRPSFATLQRRMHVTSKAQVKRLSESSRVRYMLFDLLWLDGHSLMALPYRQRRELLAALHLDGGSWQTPEPLSGKGADVLRATAEQGLEGVVAKRLDSPYQPGQRTGAWLKIKNVGRQELVIGGWVPGAGRRKDRIGALLVGVYDAQAGLHYAGRVGTGFSEQELDRLAALLRPLGRKHSPFAPGPTKPPREAVFAEPRLVAEIEFSEWTSAGSLRHPVYKGLREDKRAEQVVREDDPAAVAHADALADDPSAQTQLELDPAARQATVSLTARELRLSNLRKVLYPDSAFTKREVIEYYASVAEVLLPHLDGRPLTVKRWPDGVQGKSFFQKQAPAHRPQWVRTVAVRSASKTIDYLLADGLATLVWLANLAALELHVPMHRAPALDRPTALVFDLDPGPPASIVECCRVALQLQGMLEGLGLRCFAKTSGKKGLQVYVPLNGASSSYAQTKPFARAVAETFERAMPELVVSQMTKKLRASKVLIDWSQNDINKTTVCVYSLRATPHPTVSTPVSWEEVRATLDSGDPDTLSFQAPAVLARVAERGDLFAEVLSLVQELPAL